MIQGLDPTDDDIAASIHGLFQRAYREEARLIGVQDFPPLRRSVEDICAATTAFLGCWIDEQLAGVVEFSYQSARLSIDSLVIEPRFFRRGLARQLLQGLLERLTWESAEVETAALNHPAIALYRGFGFTESRRWHSNDGIEKVQLTMSRSKAASNTSRSDDESDP